MSPNAVRMTYASTAGAATAASTGVPFRSASLSNSHKHPAAMRATSTENNGAQNTHPIPTTASARPIATRRDPEEAASAALVPVIAPAGAAARRMLAALDPRVAFVTAQHLRDSAPLVQPD